jgi:hypothetical protein
LTWFYVSHTAKSQVPQMSAKQQECDSAGNAQGAKDLSAINNRQARADAASRRSQVRMSPRTEMVSWVPRSRDVLVT